MIADFINAVRSGYKQFLRDYRTRRTKRRTRVELMREGEGT